MTLIRLWLHSLFSCNLQSVWGLFCNLIVMFFSDFSECFVFKLLPIVCFKDMFKVQEAPTTTFYVRLYMMLARCLFVLCQPKTKGILPSRACYSCRMRSWLNFFIRCFFWMLVGIMIGLLVAFRNATKTQDTNVYIRAFPSQVYKAPFDVNQKKNICRCPSHST